MAEGIVVNIQGDDINKMIAQAILDSTLGEHVNKAVQQVVNEMGKVSYSGDSRVIGAVRDVVNREIGMIVREEYSDVIRERIRAEVDKQLAPEGGLVEKVVTNMLEGRYRD